MEWNLINIKVRIAIGLSFTIALIGLLFPIDYNVYWDQCVYLLHSKYFSGQEIGYSELLFRSPFLSFITAPISLLSNNIIVFRIVSLLFTVLLIISSFFYFERTSNKKLALILTIFFSTFGIIQQETKYFLTDIPAMSFFFLSLLNIHSKYKARFFVSGLLFGFAIITRLGYLYFAPAMAIYFILNMKEWKKEIPISLLGFLSVYTFYNIWIYNEFNTIFENISRARFEGHWVASYSFKKVSQIFYVCGFSSIIYSLFSLKNLTWNKSLFPALMIFTTFVVVPYNPENNRFIIPAVPFLLYLSIEFLMKVKSRKLQTFLLFVFCVDTSYNLLNHRSLINYYSQEEISRAKEIALSIPSDKYNTIYTNIFYPSLAYYAGMELVVPRIVSHENDEFHYVDHAFLKQPGYVVTDNKGPINRSYLNGNSHFKLLKDLNGIGIYEYDGKFSNKIKQYRLYILEAPFNLYAHGRGYLEMNQGKIKKVLLAYNIVDQFLTGTNIKNCTKGKKIIRFTYPGNIDINDIKIESKDSKSIWISFSPKNINGCKFNPNFFKLRYDLINYQKGIYETF